MIEATGPEPAYLEQAMQQQELVDSFPAEIRRFVWERGFIAGVAAWREWKVKQGQLRRAR